MTEHAPIHVLFLCNHNAARSLLAEAVLNHIGGGRLVAHSAGSSPRPDGLPHPLTLQALDSAGIATTGLRSKNWSVYACPDAPHMDLVITLCDEAAGEACPAWPGHPATAHWSYPEPRLAEGPEEERLYAFKQMMHALHQRLELLQSLPLATLDRLVLETEARRLAGD